MSAPVFAGRPARCSPPAPAALAARPRGARRSPPRRSPPGSLYKVPRVFWPLIGAFIAFVLLAIIMGWIMDAPRRRGDGRR